MALYDPEGYRHPERQSLERIVAAYDRLILASRRHRFPARDVQLPAAQLPQDLAKAEPEGHMAHVRGQSDEYPMAGNPDAMAHQLRNILTAREVLFAGRGAPQYVESDAGEVPRSHPRRDHEEAVHCVVGAAAARGSAGR
jgi:hypothetical protein